MSYSELRRFRRAQLGSDYFIHFHVNGRFFFGIRLLSLGVGGCSAKVPQMLSESLQTDSPLSRIHLVHPDLPKTQLRGRIAWVRALPRNLADTSVEVGIEFQDMEPEFMDVVDAHILQLLKQPI
jgi:PilZ domain